MNSPNEPASSAIKPLHVLRDVGIVFGLTLIGGFVIGIASAGVTDRSRIMVAIAVSNLIFSTIGFFIAGCLTIENRWKHLWLVGAGVWLTSLINVAFFGTTLIQWIFASVFVAITLAIGGGLSTLMRNPKPTQISAPTIPTSPPPPLQEPPQQ